MNREAELQKMTRHHLVNIIEDDLTGNAENLKEVWEQTNGKKEQEIVNRELRRIVALLEAK